MPIASRTPTPGATAATAWPRGPSLEAVPLHHPATAIRPAATSSHFREPGEDNLFGSPYSHRDGIRQQFCGSFCREARGLARIMTKVGPHCSIFV